jgi:hypothetical protein
MNIYQKLSALKSEIGTLKKNAKNPHFKNSYIDLSGLLDAVEPLMQAHGLLLLQPITDGVVWTIIVDIESAEKLTSNIALPIGVNPQQLGSAITYYRRYTLQSLLSLSAEDDDANTAAAAPVKKYLNAEQLNKAVAALQAGTTTVEAIVKHYSVTIEQLAVLNETKTK